MLKIREIEIENLKNEYLKMREYYDTKNNQFQVLYECMVTKYHQMETKYKEFEEKKELINMENAHIKFVTQWLQKTVEELPGCLVKNVCSNDDTFPIEVSE